MDIILSYLIVIFLILMSLAITKKYKLLGFIALVALIGSDTDSAGILYAIEAYIPGYKIIIRGLIFFFFIYSVVIIFKLHLKNKIEKKFIYWYFYPLLISTIMIFLINMFRGVGVVVSLSEVIWLGTPIFFIWTLGSYNRNSENVFLKIITYQALITITILLTGSLTAQINGASYASIIGGNIWDNYSDQIINSGISLGDFNKHSLSVFKFAQYHNPNALGVYAATMIATSIYLIVCANTKRTKVVRALLLLIIGIISWYSSLTRGPIFLMSFVFLIYMVGIFIKPKSYKRVFMLLMFVFLTLFASNSIIKILDFIFVNSNSISLLSRLDGYNFAFNSIINNMIFGVMPTVSDPIPHLFSLKIAAYYGIPTAILITIPFIHLIISNLKIYTKDILIGKSENSLFPTMLSGILLGAFLTNGVVVYVLFWILFSEAIQRLGVIDTTDKNLPNKTQKNIQMRGVE